MTDLKDLLADGAEPAQPRALDPAADLIRGRRALRIRRTALGAGLMAGLAVAVSVGMSLGGARAAAPSLPVGTLTTAPPTTTPTAPRATGDATTAAPTATTSAPIATTAPSPASTSSTSSSVHAPVAAPMPSTTTKVAPKPTSAPVPPSTTTTPLAPATTNTTAHVIVDGLGQLQPSICGNCRQVNWHPVNVTAGSYTLRCERDGGAVFYTGTVRVGADNSVSGDWCAIDPHMTKSVRVGLLSGSGTIYSAWTAV